MTTITVTYRLFFYYIACTCYLVICSFNTSTNQDDLHPISGCKFTYPRFVSSSTEYIRIDILICKNMWIHELPLYDNVTRMELINIPVTVLNETEIPKSIRSEKVNVEQLRWTRSHIKTLQYLPFPNLVELDLTVNIIQEIYEYAFYPTISLRKLNMSRNYLEQLPQTLFAKQNVLQSLCISHNRLTTLPPEMLDNLHSLETLDLSNNFITHFKDRTFQHVTKLQTLNLSFNRLNLLPSTLFHSLTSLQHLLLHDNYLAHIEPDTFANLHSLLVLNIMRNPLWSLPVPLLPDNNTLFILAISHTRLVNLKSTIFANLQTLHKLYLTDNRNLQNLPNDVFANLKNLRVIEIQNNNFTQLPHSITDIVPHVLRLDGNPWPCDCSVQWILYWIFASETLRNNVRLNAFCNSSATDMLVDTVVYKMQCKPVIVSVSPVSYQSLETKIQLRCQAYSNPQPSVSWVTPTGLYLQPDTDIDHNAFENYQHLSQNGNENVFLYENGDLDIKQMNREDAGEYVCIATNQYGQAFAYTRLYVDPTIMQRIKTRSIICGFLWINMFLVFSIVYVLIRKYTRKAKLKKRKQRMHENMDIYKTQQISKLRERCKNQMNRIKNNCCMQVEWMKDNYKESINNSSNNGISYLTTKYNQQMAEIRDYYILQIHKVREQYEQQYNLIAEFNDNRTIAKDECKTRSKDDDVFVKIENGNAPTGSMVDDEDIYKYNDTMKSEIQKLTSLRNLHKIYLETSIVEPTIRHDKLSNLNFTAAKVTPKLTPKEEQHRNNNNVTILENETVSNGKLRTSPEKDDDERTNMLNSSIKLP